MSLVAPASALFTNALFRHKLKFNTPSHVIIKTIMNGDTNDETPSIIPDFCDQFRMKVFWRLMVL